MFSSRRKLQKTTGGFSLIEVLITSAVIGILTAVVVVRQGAFNSTILLKNQAYEIAIAIREAQVYSISTRGEASAFRDDYGVSFDLSGPLGTAQKMTLFVDSGAVPGRLDSGGDVSVEEMNFDTRYEVTDFCVTDVSTSCASDPGNPVNKLSIIFARPDFDAQISAERGGSFVGDSYNKAVITLTSIDSSGFERTITVSGTGQISVQ